VVKGAIYSIAS